jgi:hypothetical protein
MVLAAGRGLPGPDERGAAGVHAGEAVEDGVTGGSVWWCQPIAYWLSRIGWTSTLEYEEIGTDLGGPILDDFDKLTPVADALVKPDMRAVLERTNLSINIHSFLLPVFEALSNSIDGIEDRFGEDAARAGKIKIRFENLDDPENLLIGITDNGSGLNNDNYISFRTPFSGYKLRKRGRGFGRFIAFKVFNRIHYSTRYVAAQEEATKTFRFDISCDEEIIFFDGEPDFEGLGLCVEFNEPLPVWNSLIARLSEQEIKYEFGAHFLPQFLYRGLPEISLQFDDGEIENITAYFKSTFVEHDSGEIHVSIDGVDYTLRYNLTKIPKTQKFTSHCLLFSAADRIVGQPRELSNKLGAVHYTDKFNQKYIIVATVSGDVFETRLNDSRTSLDVSPKAIEEIVGAVCEKIQDRETDQVQKIKAGQAERLNAALHENPILRLGLRGKTLGEYVALKPNNWGPEQFVQDLALSRYRNSGELRRQIAEAASNVESYAEKIQELASRIDAGKKEALAEYVIHRKSIIELIDAARKFGASEKRGSEDDVHSLIFRRFSDNADVEYFQHNLWLIDDALAFLPYVSSDRTTHGGSRQKGDKVTDLLFYDDTMVLGDEDGSTLTIVEFKRPSRNDYRFGPAKSDPVTQVIDTLEKAVDAGGITRTDGSHMSFGNVSRRQAYIVADLTSSLIDVLRRHDFANDYNPRIWTRYRRDGGIFIQAFGYDTLVEMAKKRNQAFSKVLLDE